MSTSYKNKGPIYLTQAKYDALKNAAALVAGQEYRIIDWEAQGKLTAGNNISIDANNVISAVDTVYSGVNGILVNATTKEITADTSVLATAASVNAKQDTLVSGNNIKTINNNSLLGSGNVAVETYQPFPETWVKSGTLEQVVMSMLDDPAYAKQGMAYLGGIEGSCTPFGYGNVECTVTFLLDYIAVLSVSSSNVAPYRWEYNTAAGDFIWRKWNNVAITASSASTATEITIDGTAYALANASALQANINSLSEIVANKQATINASNKLDYVYLDNTPAIFDPNTPQVQIGLNAVASGSNSMALGDNAQAASTRSVAIGASAFTNASFTTAIGSLAGAYSTNSTAIGHMAKARGDYSLALGCNANAVSVNSVQIGGGINSNANSLQFRNTVVVDGNGQIHANTADSVEAANVNGLSNLLISKLDKAPDGENNLIDDNNKINTRYIPDAILGQMLFGGSFDSNGIATISSNLKSKLGITDATIQLVNSATDDKTVTPKEYGYKTLEAVYFLADASFTIAGMSFEVGDWLVSIGTAWKKIDNTDAVTSVNGRTGAVVIPEMEDLSFDASGWTEVEAGAKYTKTVATAKHPMVCYNSSNEVVFVSLSYNGTNVTITAPAAFAGHVLVI